MSYIEGKGGGLKAFTVGHKMLSYLLIYYRISFILIILIVSLCFSPFTVYLSIFYLIFSFSLIFSIPLSFFLFPSFTLYPSFLSLSPSFSLYLTIFPSITLSLQWIIVVNPCIISQNYLFLSITLSLSLSLFLSLYHFFSLSITLYISLSYTSLYP